MSQIIKNKNFLEFYLCEGSTPYLFNINSGELLGKKGSPLKTTPSGIMTMVEEHREEKMVLRFLSYIRNHRGLNITKANKYTNLLKICDKIDSLGYEVKVEEDVSPIYLEYINNHIRDFAQYVRNNSEDNLRTFYTNHSAYVFAKEFGLKVDEYLTADMVRFIEEAFPYEDKIPYVAYFLSHGLWDYYENETSRLRDRLTDYFYMCDYVNYPYRKNDFMREYVAVLRTYTINKEKVDRVNLEQNQNEVFDKLSFEYGDLEVNIPITPEEFLEEGARQNNCVARIYLPKVIRGETNIVFVRRKENPNKSYITCEVRKGEIIQFLAKHNSRDLREEDRIFAKEYQEHLRKIWREE